MRELHVQKKDCNIDIDELTYVDNTMLTKVQEAVEMRAEHVRNFLDLSVSLPTSSVISFSKLIHEWEASKSKANPFEATVAGNVS